MTLHKTSLSAVFAAMSRVLDCAVAAEQWQEDVLHSPNAETDSRSSPGTSPIDDA